MLRDPKVIEHLNIQLTNELTAINQYFLHARTLDHWGVTKLGKKEYAESIEEMKHADELIQRILFLDGLPNVQRMNQIAVGRPSRKFCRPICASRTRRSKTCARGLRTAKPYAILSPATC
jgi:bacterioferritin